MVVIRKMSESDISQVAELERACFSVPWSEQAFEEALSRTYAFYFVAKQDDVVVGYCGAYGMVDEGDINQVAVRKDFRRQGIAGLLVSHLIKELAQKGFRSVTLEVRMSNEAAIGLYESLGFKKEGVRKDFYDKPKEDAIIMWKR